MITGQKVDSTEYIVFMPVLCRVVAAAMVISGKQLGNQMIVITRS